MASKDYVNGVLTNIPTAYSAIAMVSNGVAVFVLTRDGTPNGVPIFKDIIPATVRAVVNASDAIYQCGWVLAPDLKTLTVTVKKPAAITIAKLGIAVPLGVQNAANGVQVVVTLGGSS